MEIKSTPITTQNSAHKKASFSSLELDRAKKDLEQNPCIGAKLPIYDGIPDYVKEAIIRRNDLYEQAKNSIDVFA